MAKLYDFNVVPLQDRRHTFATVAPNFMIHMLFLNIFFVLISLACLVKDIEREARLRKVCS